MKKTTLFLSSLFFFFSPLLVLAEEVGEVAGEGFFEQNFWLEELSGIFFAVMALFYMVKVYKSQSQGALGVAFKYYMIGLIVMTCGLLWRGSLEFVGEEDLFINEVVFEFSIAAMLALFTAGSYKANKALQEILK